MSVAITSSQEIDTTSHNSSFVPVCKEHIDDLAATLRPADAQEIAACYQLPVREALELCVSKSVHCLSFMYRGKVAAIGGVEPATFLGRRGCVWLWTSQEVARCPIQFFKASRQMLMCWSQAYPLLYAACAINYSAAQRYISRLGGKPVGEAFYLADPFIRFQLYQFQLIKS